MGHGKFTKGYLPAQGDVTVTGPFDPDDPEVDFARIAFLVVQGRAQDTVVVRGNGEWHRNLGPEWRGTVPRRGNLALGPSAKALQVDDGRLTRGIALSVVVQPGHVLKNGKVFPRGKKPKPTELKSGAAPAFDPPAIEALTWCADFEIVSGPPPPRRRRAAAPRRRRAAPR